MAMMLLMGRYKYDHGGSGEKSSSSAASGAETSRREKEGAAYCRRDKTGSAAQWFSHDHVDNDVGGGQKTKSVSGGSVNAARMRSESDCWYNYDKAASQDANTAGVQKKRGAGVKPGSNEMHGVFHHANWTVIDVDDVYCVLSIYLGILSALYFSCTHFWSMSVNVACWCVIIFVIVSPDRCLLPS